MKRQFHFIIEIPLYSFTREHTVYSFFFWRSGYRLVTSCVNTCDLVTDYVDKVTLSSIEPSLSGSLKIDLVTEKTDSRIF